MLQFLCKKTTSLTTDEIVQLCELFSQTFKITSNIEKFKKQFLNNPYGFSYHGLIINDGKIVGSYSAIPFQYRFFDQKKIFALAVDTMIAEGFRGNLLAFKKMAECVYVELIKDGIPFIFGFPNKKAYLIRKKYLKWRDIGKLNFYIHPLKISPKFPFLKLIDPCVGFFSKTLNLLAGISCSLAKKPCITLQKDEDFENYRYSFYHSYSDYSEPYKKLKLNGLHAHYRNENFFGITASFLIDLSAINVKSLGQIVKEIARVEFNKSAVIFYIGNLGNMQPWNLIKIPSRLEPKQIYMSGLILDPKQIDDRIFDLSEWSVNLANFDVL